MKPCDTKASNPLAERASTEEIGHAVESWHIELRRLDKGWRAVVEGGGAVRSEASLHELIRWLAEMAAGRDRPSHGLR